MRFLYCLFFVALAAAAQGQVPTVQLSPAEDSLFQHVGIEAPKEVLTDPADILQKVGSVVQFEATLLQATLPNSGKVLYLDFFGRYPDNPFSVMIFAEHFGNFPEKEVFLHKKLRVWGQLSPSKQPSKYPKPKIVLRDPSQLTILD
jgi:hypothetical protein